MIDHLISIHDKSRAILSRPIDERFTLMRSYMNTFIKEDVTQSELKTILIITKGFQEQEDISDIRSEIYTLYNEMKEL